MSNHNIIFIIRCCVALFLALQAWVWLRLGGALWLSDSLDLMETLFKSVSPLKISLEGFLIFIIPVLVASLIVQKRLPAGTFVSISVLLGVFSSVLYFIFMASMNLAFIKQQIWVYVVAGSISGLVFGTILSFPWEKSLSSASNATDSRPRRKVLGLIGLLAGTTGLVGSLLGPFYLLRNQGKYIDVKLGLLEEGQMMVAKVANKPVWLLKRTPEVISLLKQENVKLRDPHSKYSRQPKLAENNLRSIRPEYLTRLSSFFCLTEATFYESFNYQ